MSRRPRKCWSDCKEVQHTCLNSHQHYTVHGHSLHFTAGPLYCFVNTCRFRHLYIEINQLICLWIIIALVYAVIAVACHLCVTCVVERAKTWDDIVRSLCISASSLVPFWLMCHCVLSGHFAMQHSVHKHFLYKKNINIGIIEHWSIHCCVIVDLVQLVVSYWAIQKRNPLCRPYHFDLGFHGQNGPLTREMKWQRPSVENFYG